MCDTEEDSGQGHGGNKRGENTEENSLGAALGDPPGSGAGVTTTQRPEGSLCAVRERGRGLVGWG